MKYLVCNINAFDAKQKIIYIDTEKNVKEVIAYSDIASLGEVIVFSCKQYEVTKVCLYGSLYPEKISKDIYALEKKYYDKNTIEIEVR